MADFKEAFEKLNADYNSLNEGYTTGNCWRLSTTMQELEGALREYVQEITKDEILQIITKLKSKEQLDENEVEYLKLWIAGDADYYVQTENNFNDWVTEFNRLIKEINKFHDNKLSFSEASNLRAMLLDGIRVAGDILFFLKQKDRINNFTESTKDIDPEERDLLIRLLEGKIRSPNE